MSDEVQEPVEGDQSEKPWSNESAETPWKNEVQEPVAYPLDVCQELDFLIGIRFSPSDESITTAKLALYSVIEFGLSKLEGQISETNTQTPEAVIAAHCTDVFLPHQRESYASLEDVKWQDELPILLDLLRRWLERK